MKSTAEYLTVANVAASYGVSELTVRKLVRSGEIPAVRIGRSWRIPRSDFETAIREAAQSHGEAA